MRHTLARSRCILVLLAGALGCAAPPAAPQKSPMESLKDALADPATRPQALLDRSNLRLARESGDASLLRQLVRAQWEALPAPTTLDDYDALSPQVQTLAEAAGVPHGLALFELVAGFAVDSLDSDASVFLAESEPLYLALRQTASNEPEDAPARRKTLRERGRGLVDPNAAPLAKRTAEWLFVSAAQSEHFWQTQTRTSADAGTRAAAARLHTLQAQRANAGCARFQIAWLRGRAVPAMQLFEALGPARETAAPDAMGEPIGESIRDYAAWRWSLGLKGGLEGRFGPSWWKNDDALRWLREALDEPARGDRKDEHRWLTAVAQTLLEN